MKKSDQKIKRSRAAYKAHRTRQMNALQRQYDSEKSAGKKAAIKREMNKLAGKPLPI